MKQKTRNEHIIVDATTGGTFRCKNCNGFLHPPMPISIGMWLVMSKQFQKEHGKCKKK